MGSGEQWWIATLIWKAWFNSPSSFHKHVLIRHLSAPTLNVCVNNAPRFSPSIWLTWLMVWVKWIVYVIPLEFEIFNISWKLALAANGRSLKSLLTRGWHRTPLDLWDMDEWQIIINSRAFHYTTMPMLRVLYCSKVAPVAGRNWVISLN